MIKINSQKDIENYVSKFKLDYIFENDMKECMELHCFNRGEYIYTANEEINYFYFLVKGKAKVYTITNNGKALLLKFYKPLGIMGDVEYIGERSSHCNVQALEDVWTIGISFDNLKKHTKNDMKFLRYVSKELTVKLSTSSNSSALNLLYPLENRLASYILALSNDNSILNKEISEIDMFKLKDIAELLGSSYRHLLRTIDVLENKNIIERKRNHIKILDIDKLEELAMDLYE